MEFMTDNFAIVSRDVMDHYTSMADEFESCVYSIIRRLLSVVPGSYYR